MRRWWTSIISRKPDELYAAAKEFVFRAAPLRVLCCLLLAAALLLYWLYAETGEIAFVYNAF